MWSIYYKFFMNMYKFPVLNKKKNYIILSNTTMVDVGSR